MSYQDIKRGNRFDGMEIMHLADETNHVQYIHVTDIDTDEEPFERRCDECSMVHAWRRVWVKA